MIETSEFSVDACVRGCPIVSAARIEIPVTLWWTWVQLCREVTTEWLAFLYGEVNDGIHVVTDCYYPRQRASSVSAEELPGEVRPGSWGKVHSHVDMAARFSGTDLGNANWTVDIVVNRRADYEASCRVRLECGRWGHVPATVRLTGLDALPVLRAAIVQPELVQQPAPDWEAVPHLRTESPGPGRILIPNTPEGVAVPTRLPLLDDRLLAELEWPTVRARRKRGRK